MSCLNIDISRNTPQFYVSVTREEQIEAKVDDTTKYINPFVSRVVGIENVELKSITPKMNVDFGIVCTIGGDYILRFGKAILTWDEADNREGVVKYNTLIASGDWSLEEIQIEELL